MRPNILLACLAVLLIADGALAWGPATHIGISGSVLDQLGLLPAAIAALLARHRIAYLYGSIAADIVLAKRWSRVKQFCHHWSTGFKLLDASASDADRAFAYGYLSHLAADTVAHGKFVPHQVVVSGSSVNFGHLYWELRADGQQSGTSWSALSTVLDQDHDAHHAQLQAHLNGTLLPFSINRACFDRLNALAVDRRFRISVAVCSRLSRIELTSQELERYHQESTDRVIDVLTREARSSLLREDPNGTSALMQVHAQRRHVRRLVRGGAPATHHARESTRSLAVASAKQ